MPHGATSCLSKRRAQAVVLAGFPPPVHQSVFRLGWVGVSLSGTRPRALPSGGYDSELGDAGEGRLGVGGVLTVNQVG